MKSMQTLIRRQHPALVAIAGIALAGTTMLSAPAVADHGGAANTGILNSKQQKVCNTGFPKGQDATARGEQIIRNNTPVNIRTVNCATGDNNVTVNSQGYPDTWYGLTTCTDWGSRPGYCVFKSVRLNGRTINQINEFVQWNYTAIHELGHVSGLGHRSNNNSAMTSGEAPPISSSFDGHDFDAIRNTYDY